MIWPARGGPAAAIIETATAHPDVRLTHDSAREAGLNFDGRRVLVDSSALASSELEAFLTEDHRNRAVLSEVSCFEPYRSGRIETISRNLQLCAKYPDRFLVLRCTSEIISLEAADAVPVAEYVDQAQTAGMPDFCRLMARALAGDADLRRQVEQHVAAALAQIERTERGFPDFVNGIRALELHLGPESARLLRARGEFSTDAVEKLWRFVAMFAAENFSRHYAEDAFPAELRDALPRFLFRLSAAATMLAMWWVRNGGIQTARGALVRNDMLDMQQVALASRFDGLMTRDSKLNEIYKETMVVLRAFEDAVDASEQPEPPEPPSAV